MKRFIAAEKERFPVREAWLFGSWAYGSPRMDSDIDVGVVLDEPIGLDDEARIFSDAQRIDRKLEPIVFASEYFDRARASIVQEIKTKGIRIA
ncbi:MAG: nucleotidyltransferase domain-containing protein [Spirochaetaceae bacterium]|nr:nucleotidyltransferase domain-containing protein [Spirochaetaceae bacterium]